MARNILDLGGASWQFGQAPRQPFSPQPHDDRGAVAGWLPARVPGDVRADLLAAGRIASLDTPDGIVGSEWVDRADWWYRTEIEAGEPGVTSVLEADGIDYLSAIYLDGELLGTHEGMFARQSIVLPPRLAVPGKHELAVRVWGAGALPRLPDSAARRGIRRLLLGLGLTPEFFPDRMATSKAQYSFGWDFSPRVLSTGIWDEVRFVRCRGAYLAGVHAVAETLTEHDPTPVRWRLHLNLRRFDDRVLRAIVELRDADGEHIALRENSFTLAAGPHSIVTVESPSLRRWWAWDQGEPRLYTLSVRLTDDHGVADEAETTVGVRTVRRDRFANGAPWKFVINGRPAFLRGANWVPADILPGRVTSEDYSHLIGLARPAGINFLRIWGGGIREKRAFWDECNRLGIMAMQEFPLACAFLDHYPRNPEYLAVLESEAQGIVAQLRGHPSLVAWCGGNEISPRRERLPVRTIERVLQREDGTRPWVPASPSEGDSHNWDVWHGGAPWQSFADVRAPFMSEFGLQALPDEATVREMFPAGVPATVDSPEWRGRKLQADKLRHYAGPLPQADLVATIAATQRTQAAGLQAGIEGCRLRREGAGAQSPCGGVAFWQWNEPWRAACWSVIDRAGRPKAALEMLQRSYQPILVAARFKRRPLAAGDRFRGEIWLVNDGPDRLPGCTVELRLDGHHLQRWQEIGLLPASASRVGVFDIPLGGSPAVLELICARHGAPVAQNRYDLSVYLPSPQPFMSWLIRRAGDLLLQ